MVFVILILFYFRSSIGDAVSSFTQRFLRPVFILGNNISLRMDNISSNFASKKSLNIENQNLKDIKASLESELTNYKTLEEENISLKEILGRVSVNEDFILGTILAKPFTTLFDTLFIDIGSEQGLEIGDLVFAYGNIPIGKISNTEKNTSTVTLFTNAGEKTSGIISSQNIYIDLVGRGGNNFEIILPRDLILTKGEDIVLSGIHPYVLAKVEGIISDDRESYQKALLISPVNIQELKFVQVRK